MSDGPDKRDTQELTTEVPVKELAEMRGEIMRLRERVQELEQQGSVVARTVLGGEAVEVVIRVVR